MPGNNVPASIGNGVGVFAADPDAFQARDTYFNGDL